MMVCKFIPVWFWAWSSSLFVTFFSLEICWVVPLPLPCDDGTIECKEARSKLSRPPVDCFRFYAVFGIVKRCFILGVEVQVVFDIEPGSGSTPRSMPMSL